MTAEFEFAIDELSTEDVDAAEELSPSQYKSSWSSSPEKDEEETTDDDEEQPDDEASEDRDGDTSLRLYGS